MSFLVYQKRPAMIFGEATAAKVFKKSRGFKFPKNDLTELISTS